MAVFARKQTVPNPSQVLRALANREDGSGSKTDRLLTSGLWLVARSSLVLASGQQSLVGTDIDSTTTETSDFGDLAWIGNGL